MDERDQKAMQEEIVSSNYELATGIYEATCRLRINMCGVYRRETGKLQQMYINKSTGKTYWKDVEIGNFQD